jgi:hypothetical protein
LVEPETHLLGAFPANLFLRLLLINAGRSSHIEFKDTILGSVYHLLDRCLKSSSSPRWKEDPGRPAGLLERADAEAVPGVSSGSGITVQGGLDEPFSTCAGRTADEDVARVLHLNADRQGLFRPGLAEGNRSTLQLNGGFESKGVRIDSPAELRWAQPAKEGQRGLWLLQDEFQFHRASFSLERV